MKRILGTLLPILLIFGSACVSDTSAPKPTPKAVAQLKTMLESARNELREYEEELGKTEEQIRDRQGKFEPTSSPRLLVKRKELTEKVFQSKVNIHELEILLDEE